MTEELPINQIIPELQTTLRQQRLVILSAPPGSGKTTGVPPALLDEPWLAGRRMVILEPRRLAARMAADRMASVMHEPVGKTVGYRIRFDSRVSTATRIEVVTEGILTRRLQNDPELTGIGLVVFDEFHERSIHADLALALCLDLMDSLRDDLRILVMSATLEVDRLAAFLGHAAVIQAGGRKFPVAIRYQKTRPGRQDDSAGYSFSRTVAAMTDTIRLAAADETGDILGFLPGAGEIRQTAEALQPWADEAGIKICPLYGDLAKKNQDQAVLPDPHGRRRIVLATSIAETSLTIEGVRLVIDSGWSRVSRFDPNSGLSRLATTRVSKAAADQRCGRAGRLEPGICYRLWDRNLDQILQEHTRPEILDADLAPLALELAAWGSTDPGSLNWLDPPPAGHYAQARETLTLLAALDSNDRITDIGKRLASLPVHPRLGRMLLFAEQEGIGGTACDLAALLTERDLIVGQPPRPVDLEVRLHILAAYRRNDRHTVRGYSADLSACSRVDRAAKQWQVLLADVRLSQQPHTIGSLLAHAYPDRVAQLRPGSRHRYLLANGRGACLPETDSLCGAPYLVAADLDAGRNEGKIHLAVAIPAAEIPECLAEHIDTFSRVAWDDSQGKVVAVSEKRLLSLVLNSWPIDPPPEAVLAAMLDGIRRLGLTALPWSKKTDELRNRILSMRTWQPEEDWPDVSDTGLQDIDKWLGPYLSGISSRQQLAGLDLAAILLGMLDWDMQRRLDIDAPTHVTVPSGSRLRLQYQADGPPVLAVRLQEMFGLADTPRVGNGQVRVMLHLLSPAQRPVQITQDLKGFWNSTYPEVKKELKGRYPKHYWPDDPWSATATARVRPGSKR